MEQKTQPKPTSVRLDNEVKEWIKQRAERKSRSFNAEVGRLLKRAMTEEITQQAA